MSARATDAALNEMEHWTKQLRLLNQISRLDRQISELKSTRGEAALVEQLLSEKAQLQNTLASLKRDYGDTPC